MSLRGSAAARQSFPQICNHIKREEMKLKKKLSVLLALTVTAILLLTACGRSSDVSFGTAGAGGTYQTFADALTATLNNDTGLTVRTRETAGSAANLRLLSGGYIQLALAQADLVNDAYYATGTYSGKKALTGYKAVASLYTESCQIAVSAKSDIHSVSDLAGKKVSIGEKESGTSANAVEILASYGLSDKLVQEVQLNYSDAVQQLKEGSIDAFFCTAGTPTDLVKNLAQETDIRLLSLDEKARKNLCKAYPFFTACEIPAGTYKGQDKAISTVGVKSVLLASDSMSEKDVRAITRELFDNKYTLQKNIPAHLQLDFKDAVSGITIPFHQGAADYYASQGVTVNTKEK